MSVKVLIPTLLRNLTANTTQVEVEAANINEMIAALDEKYPGIKLRICNDKGKIRPFLNVFLNDQDIRFLDAQATVMNDGDEVSIIAAVGGGC